LVVLLFHVIDNSGRKYTYPTEKFEKIIKFLYDNGFEVVTLNDALDKIKIRGINEKLVYYNERICRKIQNGKE